MCQRVKRGPGRPPMGVVATLRYRNKRWLHQLALGEVRIAEIARHEDVSRQTVRRGVRDAASYPEMARFARALGWALHCAS